MEHFLQEYYEKFLVETVEDFQKGRVHGGISEAHMQDFSGQFLIEFVENFLEALEKFFEKFLEYF